MTIKITQINTNKISLHHEKHFIFLSFFIFYILNMGLHGPVMAIQSDDRDASHGFQVSKSFMPFLF